MIEQTLDKRMRLNDLHYIISEILHEAAKDENPAILPAMKFIAKLYAKRDDIYLRGDPCEYLFTDAIYAWLYADSCPHDLSFDQIDELIDLINKEELELYFFLYNHPLLSEACNWLREQNDELMV